MVRSREGGAAKWHRIDLGHPLRHVGPPVFGRPETAAVRYTTIGRAPDGSYEAEDRRWTA